MAEQSQSKETPRAALQFGKSTRRRFLSRLGMASLLASAGPVLGERSRTEPAATPETKEAMSAVEGAIPVTLRVNGKTYDLRIDPPTTRINAVTARAVRSCRLWPCCRSRLGLKTPR